MTLPKNFHIAEYSLVFLSAETKSSMRALTPAEHITLAAHSQYMDWPSG